MFQKWHLLFFRPRYNKYYCFFFFSLSIQATKSLFSETSFVLRCKSRKLFFFLCSPRHLALVFFSPHCFFCLVSIDCVPSHSRKKKKLVEIFVFVPNLYWLEFETETKRTNKLWSWLWQVQCPPKKSVEQNLLEDR